VDLENGLLHAALTDAELFSQLGALHIDPKDFDNQDIRRAFEFTRKYEGDHHSLPTIEAVNDLCQVSLRPQGVNGTFLVTELMKRKAFRRINDTIESAQGQLRSNDPDAAFEKLRELVEDDVGPKVVKPTTVFEHGKAVIDLYEKVKAGFTGVPLPWATLSAATLGLWPKTSTYFAARPGVGKTWVAMLIARHAWQLGYRVLMVSPEMSKAEIAERFFVVEANVSGNNVIKGTLSDFEFARLKEKVDSMQEMDGLFVLDSEDDLTPSGLSAAIRSCKPTLLCCDSIYMLGFKGDRTERTVRAIDWFRRVAKRYDMATCGFHQLSRAAVKNKKSGGVGYEDSAIALTDQLFWDAHAVFIMEQDADMRADKRLKFHTRKVRRGMYIGDKPVEVYWDFDAMKFDEIGKPEGAEEFEDTDYKPNDDIPF
jgi:KaiC/GvpD/RAD55 family RecA-like ATPase